VRIHAQIYWLQQTVLEFPSWSWFSRFITCWFLLMQTLLFFLCHANNIFFITIGVFRRLPSAISWSPFHFLLLRCKICFYFHIKDYLYKPYIF
jgi:hypothetical protein